MNGWMRYPAQNCGFEDSLFLLPLLVFCVRLCVPFSPSRRVFSSFLANMRPRRPCSSVSAVTVHNSFDMDNQRWIPSTIAIGSWVMLQTRKRKSSINEFMSTYKGRVKEFRVSDSSRRVKEVLIQHAYMHRELRLRLPAAIPLHRPNYIYPSNLEDWQSLDSIVGIFDAHHACIGALKYRGRSGRSLAEKGVFFYDMFYTKPHTFTGYGSLQALPPPSFDSPDWPLPSAETSECFRLKIHEDVQRCMRPNVASRQVKIALFMPLHVFVDFFHDEEVRRTSSMFICKSENCLDFLDVHWDVKDTNGIVCRIQRKSIVCKYTIGSQNFILSFHYMRWHHVNGRLVAVDQDMLAENENPLMLLEVWLEDQLLTVLNVRSNISLRQVRTDLENEDDVEVPNGYMFAYNDQKVPRRKERTILVNDNTGKKVVLVPQLIM